MEYTGEGIEALVATLDDLQTSGLIMADKKIRSVLKCLAYYSEFRTVLAYCNEGFDYAAEKRKALQKAGDYHVLRLPTNPKTLVPLVAGLMGEFDEGTEDFIAFCSDYYPAAGRQESMEACCHDMMERFLLHAVHPKAHERELEALHHIVSARFHALLSACGGVVGAAKSK